MKRSVITGLFLLLSVLGFSQGEFNIWYFGDHAGVDFNSGIPVALTNCNSTFSDRHVSSSISDSSGNLLFYAGIRNMGATLDGTVYNKNHQIMPNGHNLFSGFMTIQNYLAVQKLNDDSSYYLFTMDCEYSPLYYTNPQGLTYSVINMRLDGGLGDIVTGQKNINVPGALQTRDMLSGTRHKNNRDVWITVRNYWNSYSYLTYLVTSSGINPVPVVSNSFFKLVYPYNIQTPSMIRFSPDGTKLVCMYLDSLEYCAFNSSTGQITPLFKLSCVGSINPNAEFSINSKYLYVLTQGSRIDQYDATKTDLAEFVQSKVFITSHSSDEEDWLQRGPDNKIYVAEGAIDSLGVIQNPNVQGTGCNYQRNVVFLAGNNNLFGLPQFLERYYVYIHHTGQCQGNGVSFYSTLWPPADSIHWDFGDPGSGSSNFSNLDNPTHVYSLTGSFTITLFVRHIDQRTDSAWQVVTILPSPQPALGPDRTVCIGDSVTFDAGFCSGCTYLWKDSGTGLTVGTSQTFRTGLAGNYAVTVSSPNSCIGRDTVQLFTTPIPVVTNTPPFKTICTGDSTHIVLTSNAPGANFYWIASLTSGNVTGFTADSGLVINQVLVDHNSSPGVVTYHIIPKVGSCIGTSSDYEVTVNPGDSVNVSITASENNVCAGTSVTFIASPINGGTNPAYQWKVNGTDAGTNSPVFTYTPANGDQVSCILTSSNTICAANNPATSDSITMVVNPNLAVNVSVVGSQNPVCAGTSVTFLATPDHGGTSPQYQWKVNGGNVGTNDSIYSYTPNNGDAITCTLTSSETCTTGNPAISNQIIMTVNPKLPVSISISASSNPFCIGNSVTFTATHTNGGSSPSYQWKVNGANVSIDTLYTYYPVSGDMVSCVFTSSASCVTGNPATSNTITMTGTTGLPVGVSINANPNPFCPGSSVTCTATPSNGGTNPVYQWKVNGVNVGINSPTYTFNPLNNDSVRCVMTSNLSCVSGNPATSNKIILSGTLAPIVTFTRCFDSITTINAKPIKLKGGIPLGGTYSGQGVNSTTGVFTPSVAGTGTKTITYSYTNFTLCSASKTKTIIVQSAPVFTCGNNLTDIRDNKIYPTVQIGSQCWMAANLNYGNRVPGTGHQRDNCVPEKYCYNDLTANCELGTANYQWDELMQYDDTPGLKGLCPPGWHIPTENDWNTLFANYINNAFAGAPLKYSGYSGFNALLSGVRHMNVQWDFQNFATFFWSSTPYGANKAWSHGMNDYDPSVSAYPSSRANAFSVRCIKD